MTHRMLVRRDLKTRLRNIIMASLAGPSGARPGQGLTSKLRERTKAVDQDRCALGVALHDPEARRKQVWHGLA